MTINVIELMDAVIVDTQELLDEIGENEKAQRYISAISNMAQKIRIELDLLFAADGSIKIDPKLTLHYTQAPFAIISTNAYILRKRMESNTNSSNEITLTKLDKLERNVADVKYHLDQIWGDD